MVRYGRLDTRRADALYHPPIQSNASMVDLLVEILA
jgi:hypothetical protein